MRGMRHCMSVSYTHLQVLSEEKADALIDFCLNRMEEVEDMSVIGGLLKA